MFDSRDEMHWIAIVVPNILPREELPHGKHIKVIWSQPKNLNEASKFKIYRSGQIMYKYDTKPPIDFRKSILLK